MPDFIPAAKPALQVWTNNFVTVCVANVTVLALTPTDITNLQGLQSTFTSALNASNAAKQAMKSATDADALATKNLTNDARALARRFQANAAVSPILKQQLGITPKNVPKNHTAPITPTGVMVEGFSTGVNTVKWNRAGNKSNTIFRVEALIGTAADFVEIGATQATTLDHTGQTPGVKVVYRVVAYRAKQASVPSTEAVVYNNALGGPSLTMSKAA